MSQKSSTFAPAFVKNERDMVVIAQLAEHRIVVPSVVGSSPTLHPRESRKVLFLCVDGASHTTTVGSYLAS